MVRVSERRLEADDDGRGVATMGHDDLVTVTGQNQNSYSMDIQRNDLFDYLIIYYQTQSYK